MPHLLRRLLCVLLPLALCTSFFPYRAAADDAARQAGRAFVITPRGEQPFYCTHLVLDAVRRQGAAFEPQWQYLDIAVFRGEYLFPQAFLAADTETVYRYDGGE